MLRNIKNNAREMLRAMLKNAGAIRSIAREMLKNFQTLLRALLTTDKKLFERKCVNDTKWVVDKQTNKYRFLEMPLASPGI